jgi:hypothetical protein
LQHLGVYAKLVEILNQSLHLEENETSVAIAALNSETESAKVSQIVRNKQKTAELVIHLMLSMSADPIMTETLALAGIMRVLSNNTLRAFHEMHVTYANVRCTHLATVDCGFFAHFRVSRHHRANGARGIVCGASSSLSRRPSPGTHTNNPRAARRGALTSGNIANVE